MMNDDQPKPVVSLNKLAEDMDKPLTRMPPGILAKPTPTRGDLKQHNSLQSIAIACTKLTWKEAEKMGAAIQVKMKEGGQLTSAIQSWAEEWEKFGDE
jgi:hypothetical protein